MTEPWQGCSTEYNCLFLWLLSQPRPWHFCFSWETFSINAKYSSIRIHAHHIHWNPWFISCVIYPLLWQIFQCLCNIKTTLNTLRLRLNGRHFPGDIFKWIFLNENVWISINISLKFVPRGPINNIPILVQVMAWRRPGDKPLSEPIMVRFPMHICITRPQWLKYRDFHYKSPWY